MSIPKVSAWTWTILLWDKIICAGWCWCKKRTPWENTLLYYPLTSDLVDVMWNGDTGVAHWTITFNANPGSTTWVYVHWTAAYVTWMSMWITGRNTWTVNFRANFISMDWTYAVLVWRWDGYNSGEPMKLIWEKGQQLWIKSSVRNSYTDTSSDYPSKYIALNTWYHNFWLTLDNWILHMYVDWQKVTYWWWQDWLNIWTVYSWKTGLCLWYTASWDSRDKPANWYVRDYIVETVPWTDDEFECYYKLTKSNFWIS